ncbi:TPM domain-containing protein [Blattabacterium cuenoti]|uniref:TPM domain-containing protein n=1 Tax=Blattabacterium cuenoti TaxID=1653831 RepID=UPI00163B7A93|nr:TPM domain-containing protein [Blattabacterium cuenoti]
MKIVFKKILFLLILLNIISLIKLEGKEFTTFIIPKPPNVIYPVHDYANVLSIKEIKDINKKLILYSNNTSTEILVILVNSIYKNDPKMIAQEWGEKWKIGGLKNNGIVILLSIKDKKISIQNGYGIEPYLTDFSTKEILNKSKPFLEKGFYYKTINYCITNIYKKLGNYFYKKKIVRQKSNIISIITSIVLFILIFFIFPKILGIDFSLINTLFMINLFKNNNNINNQNHYHYEYNDEDDFDGFGNGGSFGGGGSEDTW